MKQRSRQVVSRSSFKVRFALIGVAVVSCLVAMSRLSAPTYASQLARQIAFTETAVVTSEIQLVYAATGFAFPGQDAIAPQAIIHLSESDVVANLPGFETLQHFQSWNSAQDA